MSRVERSSSVTKRDDADDEAHRIVRVPMSSRTHRTAQSTVEILAVMSRTFAAPADALRGLARRRKSAKRGHRCRGKAGVMRLTFCLRYALHLGALAFIYAYAATARADDADAKALVTRVV